MMWTVAAILYMIIGFALIIAALIVRASQQWGPPRLTREYYDDPPLS